MENAIVVNNESVTIKITIEVIPSTKKKENIKEESVAIPPLAVERQTNTPEGWDAVEPETPVVVPPVVPEPEKKKRAYTKKTKTMEPPVGEKVVETFDTPPAKPPVVPPVTTPTPVTPTSNKIVARIAQMIRFYCKASGIETSTITIAQLKEKAFDIVENVADDVITEAIKEASKK